MYRSELGKQNQQNVNRRLEKDAAGDEGEEGTDSMEACGAAGQRKQGELTSLIYLAIVEFV